MSGFAVFFHTLRSFAAVLLIAAPAIAAAAETPSGLPLPRFVTTRSTPINVRVGPGTRYDVAWIYKVAGTPVEIIQEFDTWRKIRDVDGSEGWVHQNMLSGSRAGYVAQDRRRQGRRCMRLGVRGCRRRRLGRPRLSRSRSPSCDDGWCAVVATDHPAPVPAPTTPAICRKMTSGASIRAKASTDRPAIGAGRRAYAFLHPHHHVDMGDLHALGRLGQVLDHDRRGGDVDHPLLVFEIEMVMVRRVGVEIATVTRRPRPRAAGPPCGTGAACCRSSPATH